MQPFSEKPSYKELVDKLLSASTLEDLRKIQALFVPNQEVKAWTEQKDKQLDWLDKRCAWEKHDFQLTSEELSARERYQKIMTELSAYEQRFCL